MRFRKEGKKDRDSVRRFIDYNDDGMKRKHASNKSDGIYYIVYIDGRWKVEAFRTDQYGDVDHLRMWEEYLAPYFAETFKLNEEEASLLKLSYAGFPRGRIVKIGIKYVVYHGNNYKKFVSKDEILAPFGLADAEFKFDDHERAIMENRDTIRQLLNIKETWVAV